MTTVIINEWIRPIEAKLASTEQGLGDFFLFFGQIVVFNDVIVTRALQ